MVDFIKIIIKDNPELIKLIWDNDLLIYDTERKKLNRYTGEIRCKETKVYKNLLFTRTASSLEIAHSLHYYFNDGLHNANDFTMNDCKNVVLELQTIFKLDLNACKVVNIEFGVNLSLSFDIKNTLTGLLYWNKYQFINDDRLLYSKKAGNFKDGKFQHYKTLKVYAKSIQFPEYCSGDVLRFEFKSCQSKWINKYLNIYNLSDLLNDDVYLRMSNILCGEWLNVLFVDALHSPEPKAAKYFNPFYWNSVLMDDNRNKFSKSKKRYFEYLSTVPNNKFKELKELIMCKSDALSTPTQETKPPHQKTKSGAISTISIIGNCTNDERRCIVTGLNISMQRKDSDLLSHTGLKYYHTNRPELYDMIRRKYLTDRWQGVNFSDEVRELAHNIRNRKNNCLISDRCRYDGMDSLF